MFKNFLIKHNIIKGTFYIESFVYVDENTKEMCDSSNMIKWLEPFSINCLYKDKDILAFKMLKDKYPEYSGHINLY